MSHTTRAPQARYFDYLDECGVRLQELLGVPDLVSTVALWRHVAQDQPRMVTSDVRRVAEQALWAITCGARKEDPEREPALAQYDRIALAFRCRLISEGDKRLLTEIRRLGNRAVHAGPGGRESVEDARRVLTDLERFLRNVARRNRLCSTYTAGVPLNTRDSILIAHDGDLLARARLADELRGAQGELTRQVRESQRAMTGLTERFAQGAQAYSDLAQRLEESEAALTEARLDARSARERHEEEVACLRAELAQVNDLLSDVLAGFKPAIEREENVRRRVEGVLAEHDLVARLAGEGASATREQWRVMEFPRSVRAKTTFLHISGGGGTGKTLCLIAKLIREVEGLAPDVDGGERRALFVCFNRDLAAYVSVILAGFPEAERRIEVVSFDTFVNQLVRSRPRSACAHLTPYASDVRYPSGWSIGYPASHTHDTTACVRRAMEAVAREIDDHRRRRFRAYLDATRETDVSFMEEELLWLIERYENVDEARRRYVEASEPRQGRGGMRRPRSEAREIVCMVWEAFERELTKERLYTIGQATRRLMGSHELPAYDVIAIDEAQDFSLARIRLICAMRRLASSCVYIAGDEDQRLYQRDFTWGELSEAARGHTIHLSSNMRNPPAVHAFAERLHGRESPYPDAAPTVTVLRAETDEMVELLRSLASREGESTVVIGRARKWRERLERAGVTVLRSPVRPQAGKGEDVPSAALAPGLYALGPYTVKGLEFDNVVVDLTSAAMEDEQAELRLRYVHFTRAKRRLWLRYEDEPPHLLRAYYPDFLEV